MNTIFRDLLEPGLLAAVEANFDEEMASFGRSLPGAEFHEDAELSWFLTGPAGPNGVLKTTFAHHDSAFIQRRITDTLSYFKAQGIHQMHWRIGPTTRPLELHRYLVAQGLTLKETTQCLLMPIAELGNVPTHPDNLVITEITDAATLEYKQSIEREGFGSSETTARQFRQVYLHCGFGPGTAWHHYLGWQAGRAVAMASLLLHEGVAGIYGVATLPAARRQGIAAALTYHAIREAGRLGYHFIVLSPNAMSARIYQRLGFQPYCTIQHYSCRLQ